MDLEAILQQIRAAGLTVDPSRPNHCGRERLAKLLGIGTKRARNILRELAALAPTVKESLQVPTATLPNTATVEQEFAGDRWNIHIAGTDRIHSQAELLKAYAVDERIWEVVKFSLRYHEMASMPRSVGSEGDWHRDDTLPIVTPLCSIRCEMRKRPGIEQAISIVDALQKRAESFSPHYEAIVFLPGGSKSGNMVEIALADPHFGSLSWAPETGYENYDLKTAERDYKGAFTVLLDRTRDYAPEEIVIVFGNDQQNADNQAGTTTKGTIVDCDSRYAKTCDVSTNVSIWAIEQARLIAPKVRALLVAGNHDVVTTWWLGRTLGAWFRNCPGVEVDNRPLKRKYIQHGVVLLGWGHGDAPTKLEDYAALMALEAAPAWGATSWREFHTGDKHQRRLLELKGVAIRILPSLSPPNAWASANGFVGSVRAGEAYVWNRAEGLIGTACYSILPKPIR